MATATTTETAADESLRLRQAVSALVDKWRGGEFSPYRKRLEYKDRWAALKQLVEVRGTRYVGCTFENFQTLTAAHKSAMLKVLDFSENMPERIASGAGLMFLGKPGCGKDHLMFSAMKAAIIDHGFTVRWADGLRLYARIKSAIATNDTERMLAEYVAPQILALSDPVPPRDSLSAYELACLRDIIERRYSKSLSTWCTTNVIDHATALEVFSGAVLDRLMHGAVEVNMCDLDSYRMR